MTARASAGSLGRFETVVLENPVLRAVIIPELGGRVWELEDRLRGRQWIWHREGVPLNAWPAGTSYDDVWAGGWEELFPNDAPGLFEGRQLPDHGEWWTLAWSLGATAGGETASVCLSGDCSVIRASCTKEFSLPANSAGLTVRYKIQSEEPEPFHFLFKQHLAIRLTPDCRLALPGGRVQVVDPSFGTIVSGDDPFEWPFAGEAALGRDLRDVPRRSSRDREFLYVRALPRPWCGVEDTAQGAGIRMEFDSGRLPFVWLFLTYGGWRDLYTAVLEPCTNMPKDLTEAARLGQSARLEPGEEFETVVTVNLRGLPGAST